MPYGRLLDINRDICVKFKVLSHTMYLKLIYIFNRSCSILQKSASEYSLSEEYFI